MKYLDSMARRFSDLEKLRGVLDEKDTYNLQEEKG